MTVDAVAPPVPAGDGPEATVDPPADATTPDGAVIEAELIPGADVDPGAALAIPEPPGPQDIAVTAPRRQRMFRYDPRTGETHIPTMIGGAEMTFYPNQTTLNEAQMVLLGPLGIVADWNPQHVMIFLITSMERGHNPWQKESFLWRYRDSNQPGGWKYINHTGIPGFRNGSERTGLYRGRTEVEACGDDGRWITGFWPYRDTAPYACRVGVRRAGWETTWYTAIYDEYAPTKDVWRDSRRTGETEIAKTWRPAGEGGKPYLLLGKCAEAGAHRATFSTVHATFYTTEEFDRDRAAEPARPAVSEKLRAAHAAAQPSGQPAAAVPPRETITVTTPPDVPADPDGLDPTPEPVPARDPETTRALLLTELDVQATILGKTTTDLLARWESFHRRPFGDASLAEVQAQIHKIRPYVFTVLAKTGRDTELAAYRRAPGAGTLDELFGDGHGALTTPDPWTPQAGEEDTR